MSQWNALAEIAKVVSFFYSKRLKGKSLKFSLCIILTKAYLNISEIPFVHKNTASRVNVSHSSCQTKEGCICVFYLIPQKVKNTFFSTVSCWHKPSHPLFSASPPPVTHQGLSPSVLFLCLAVSLTTFWNAFVSVFSLFCFQFSQIYFD